jgi:hypothetical protein
MPMDKQLIDQYTNAGEKLRLSVRGLTEEDLKNFPVPGTWSIQQIILHLMDSDLINADRMKRIIAEDNPTLIGYDETRFTKNLFYHDQQAEEAVTIFDLNRKNFAAILRKIPAEAFDRVGTHNEVGKWNLSQWLKRTVDHFEHHLKFIHEKRAKMGKEMW